ncbi:MAG: 50S ribosomal protein L21 [Candidatus Pacebacteria bacterium]|nr:50S ribosomal protein L21 [Candidatus Paceibacterota bacterium]NUQ57372.1 50S ribosomal protein L21 [Candidatus Paceibacter sp.]
MNDKLAVIQTGGKQYLVKAGQKIKVEKLNDADAQEGATVNFDKVLLVAEGDNIKVGKPQVAGSSVSAKVLRNGRADKITILKYKSKTRSRKKAGHRQPFTEVQIEEIK